MYPVQSHGLVLHFQLVSIDPNLILATWHGALGGLRADLAGRNWDKEDIQYPCAVSQGHLLCSAAGLDFTQSPILLQKCGYP